LDDDGRPAIPVPAPDAAGAADAAGKAGAAHAAGAAGAAGELFPLTAAMRDAVSRFDLFSSHVLTGGLPSAYPVPSEDALRRPPPPKAWPNSTTDGSGTGSPLPLLSFFSSFCRPARDRWVSALMEHVAVSAYGRCLRNTDLSASATASDSLVHQLVHDVDSAGAAGDEMLRVMGRHLFNLAHEGPIEPWYASEKLWNPFRAGTVPVYMGPSETLRREGWLPEHSWIDAASFASPAALAAYLTHLAAHPTEYEKYFAWKALPLPEMLARVKANDLQVRTGAFLPRARYSSECALPYPYPTRCWLSPKQKQAAMHACAAVCSHRCTRAQITSSSSAAAHVHRHCCTRWH
jgi:hypothetical protein